MRIDPGPPAPMTVTAAVCPVCGAAVENRQCKQICPRCRTIVANCNGD